MQNEKIATRVAYGRALAALGEKYDFFVMDADLSGSTQTAMFGKKFPERFANCGIAEENMVSTAAGIASTGLPVFVSSFAMFACGRAYEQIRNSVAYPRLNVKIAASHAGVTVGEDGATHQFCEDMALMRSLPNMTVVNPADATEAFAAVEAILNYNGPVYFRLGRYAVPVVFDPAGYRFELGKGRVLRDGKDAVIFATGIMVAAALEAGELLAAVLPDNLLRAGELPCWWLYSIALGVFFVALPFSRYMHIFTEIPLIFLRNAGLRSGERPSSYDRFQTDACSRCGICIDPCQLQRAGIHGVQAVYFLRDRRYGKLTDAVADDCLMCGRCERACPVGIEQNTLRLNSRQQRAVPVGNNRYGYAQGVDCSQGEGRVGYFAGCMTLLTPKILHAMERIFEAAGEPVWWADKDGGVCCGRPLKLSGEIDAARAMMESNRELFLKHGITTLVTSCPICLRVFREDYDLPGIEVLHHSEYIERLIAAGRLKPQTGGTVYTYHDPCELGRGCGVYDAPRGVIGRIGRLTEPEETRENALCCGSSVANLAIDDDGQRRIGESVAASLAATGAEAVVTACPLCKKAIARGGSLPVYDLSEIVAKAL